MTDSYDNEQLGYYPLMLRSPILMRAIEGVDAEIKHLEDTVKLQRERIRELEDRISATIDAQVRLSQARTRQQLMNILDYAKGNVPINDSIGLDACLILKHLDSILSKVDDESLDDIDRIDSIIDAMDEIKQYVTDGLDKTKALPRQ